MTSSIRFLGVRVAKIEWGTAGNSARVGDGTYVSNNSWNVLIKNNHPDWEKHISCSIYEPNFRTIQLINEYGQREDIIRLGTGEQSPKLLPTAALQRSLQNIPLTSRDLGYSEPKGSRQLRHALSRYAIKRGIQVTPDSIMIVSGALQALQLISLDLLEPGSTVFQESPSYLNSVRPFQSAGMRIISLDKGNYIRLSYAYASFEQLETGLNLLYEAIVEGK
ncbi:hypothetical protein [Paenibacillus sp. 79R4]|uniref:hypothetical protein n=1 Tax=Paenibacillus sp. 79R4 TaxID=2212847 RepID=UPI00356998E4